MAEKTARVAVSAAVFAIDRPYSYRIPDKLKDAASPGVRVVVPFGKGNRRSEGVVLDEGFATQQFTQQPTRRLALLGVRPPPATGHRPPITKGHALPRMS